TAVYQSEKETGHRNRGMFYIMKNSGLINGTEDQLDNYFKQCSIEVTAEDLAKIGYFFANECVRFDGDATYKSTDLSKLIQRSEERRVGKESRYRLRCYRCRTSGGY